jgi:hypothetical protein
MDLCIYRSCAKCPVHPGLWLQVELVPCDDTDFEVRHVLKPHRVYQVSRVLNLHKQRVDLFWPFP